MGGDLRFIGHSPNKLVRAVFQEKDDLGYTSAHFVRQGPLVGILMNLASQTAHRSISRMMGIDPEGADDMGLIQLALDFYAQPPRFGVTISKHATAYPWIINAEQRDQTSRLLKPSFDAALDALMHRTGLETIDYNYIWHPGGNYKKTESDLW